MLENFESIRVADLGAVDLHRSSFSLGICFSHWHYLSLRCDHWSWSQFFCLRHYFKNRRFYLCFHGF